MKRKVLPCCCSREQQAGFSLLRAGTWTQPNKEHCRRTLGLITHFNRNVEDLDVSLVALGHCNQLLNPALPLNDIVSTGLDQLDSLPRLSGQIAQSLKSPALTAVLKVVVELYQDALMPNVQAWVTMHAIACTLC